MNLMRREVLKSMGLAAGVSAVLPCPRARSAEPKRLDVKDPAAVALGYVEDAAQIDPKKYPQFAPGSNCENCLQLQGSPGNAYRPCTLFPGKLVAAIGWCTGWTPEM
jgi:hypothetical protein